MIRAAIFTMIFAIQAASATVPGYYTESATVREINGDLITIETDQQQLLIFSEMVIIPAMKLLFYFRTITRIR